MPLSFYRCMIAGEVAAPRRSWRVSHTVVADALYDSSFDAVLWQFCNDLNNPFGVVGSIPRPFSTQRIWCELYPTPTFRGAGGGYPVYSGLNPNALEGSFRLRRVGANGSIGRICYPIDDDRWYTDTPARRHIDAFTLQGYINTNLELQPKVRTLGGVTFTACIIHRRDLTWDPVDHYELMPNPVRIWRRWWPKRIYPSGYWGNFRIPDELHSHISRRA